MVRLIRRRREDVPDERGVALIVTALAMFLLLGITALVVDIVILNQAQLKAQATVDSSALAAAQDLNNTIAAATAAAQEYALRNYGVAAGDWTGCTDSAPLPVATTVNCISVDSATAPTLIRVRLPGREVPTFFGPILGIDSFTVTAVATAEVEYSGGSTGIPVDDQGFALDFQDAADFVRAGDPGNGYPKCELPLPDWPDTSLTYPPGHKWAEYILVFENPATGEIRTRCGTTSDATADTDGSFPTQWGMDTWLTNTGGMSAPTNESMFIHVSCSENFIEQEGWHFEGGKAPKPGKAVKGPLEDVDSAWHIIQYNGARYEVSKGKKASEPPAGEIFLKNGCGWTFPSITPHIRLSD